MRAVRLRTDCGLGAAAGAGGVAFCAGFTTSGGMPGARGALPPAAVGGTRLMLRAGIAGPLRRIFPPATEARTVEGGRLTTPIGAVAGCGLDGAAGAADFSADGCSGVGRTAEICTARKAAAEESPPRSDTAAGAAGAGTGRSVGVVGAGAGAGAATGAAGAGRAAAGVGIAGAGMAAGFGAAGAGAAAAGVAGTGLTLGVGAGAGVGAVATGAGAGAGAGFGAGFGKRALSSSATCKNGVSISPTFSSATWSARGCKFVESCSTSFCNGSGTSTSSVSLIGLANRSGQSAWIADAGTLARPRARSEYKSLALKGTTRWRLTGPPLSKLAGILSTKSPSSKLIVTSGACSSGARAGVGDAAAPGGVLNPADGMAGTSGCGDKPPLPPLLGNAMVRACAAAALVLGIRKGLEALGMGSSVVERGVFSLSPTGRTEFGTTLFSAATGRCCGCGASGAATLPAAGGDGCAAGAAACAEAGAGAGASTVAAGALVWSGESDSLPGLVLNQLEKEKAMRVRVEVEEGSTVAEV